MGLSIDQPSTFLERVRWTVAAMANPRVLDTPLPVLAFVYAAEYNHNILFLLLNTITIFTMVAHPLSALLPSVTRR